MTRGAGRRDPTVPTPIFEGVLKIVTTLDIPNYISRSHLESELIDARVITSDRAAKKRYRPRQGDHSGVLNRYMITLAIQRVRVVDGEKVWRYVPRATRKGQRDRVFIKVEAS